MKKPTTSVFLALILGAAASLAQAPSAPSAAGESQVPVTFTGGYDTDPRDHGRPVVLIAAALKVSSDVFREAFSHVHPAGPGSGGPSDSEARKNKAALMNALGKYGVTNDRLNEVSNYYRYASFKGDMWRNTPAAAYATVRNGAITGFVITNPGAGYSSTPKITVPGMASVKAAATLAYGTDFSTNGSVKEIVLDGKH
jgi:hypothetical protein